MALWLGLGAFSLVLVAIAFGGVIPFFGVLAHGLPGSLIALAMAGLWGCLAWGSYRVRPFAWWLTVAALGVFGLSAWVTFRQVDLVEMYRLMGYPEAQIDQIRRYSVFTGAWLSWWSVGGLIPMLGYLWWVKRFFRPGQPPRPS